MKYKYIKNTILPIILCLFSGYIGSLSAINYLSKDKKTELLHIVTEDKRKLFTETCNLINTRLFFHLKIIWKIDNIYSEKNINDTFSHELQEILNNWRTSIIDYNIGVRKISNQLRYIYNEEIEKKFAFDTDSETNPSSISGNFIKIQKDTENVLNYIRNVKENNIKFNQQEYKNKIDKIRYELEKLHILIIEFMKTFAEETFIEHKEFKQNFNK